MASPIEGLAGLGLQLTRQPDGSLHVRKLELEPRRRRLSSLLFTLIWNAVIWVIGAFMFGSVPFHGEVTESFPGAGTLILGLFGLMGLSGLSHQVWIWLGREEWQVSRNRLEVRQSLLGIPRRRTHADTQVSVHRYVQNTWVLEVGSRKQRLLLAELTPAQVSALIDLGELLARETGWPLLAPERPSGVAPPTAPAARPAPSAPREPAAPLPLDPELCRRVAPDLEPGERLLWAGQPDARRVGRQLLPVLYLGVPWTLIALRSAIGWSGHEFPFSAFPFLFALAGLGICSTPWCRYRTALVTYYAVTDRRVLILTEGKRRKLELYRPMDLCETERHELPDGSGDLLFARREEKDSDGGTRTVEIKFTGIPQVRAVERLVRQLTAQQAA